MCFSALASFSAAAGLSCLGIATLNLITSKRQILLASFPCLFAVQQTCEGLIWLGRDDRAIVAETYGFLLFATFVWLILSPLSIYLLENNLNIKRFLLGLTGVGLLLGIYLFGSIVNRGIEPQVFSGNLFYDLRFIPFYQACKYIYLVIIALPFLISQNLSLKIFGTLIFASFVVAQVIFQTTFVSVWCFFAAILSGFLYFVFKNISTLSLDRINV
jgi:hypothetical protein